MNICCAKLQTKHDCLCRQNELLVTRHLENLLGWSSKWNDEYQEELWHLCNEEALKSQFSHSCFIVTKVPELTGPSVPQSPMKPSTTNKRHCSRERKLSTSKTMPTSGNYFGYCSAPLKPIRFQHLPLQRHIKQYREQKSDFESTNSGLSEATNNAQQERQDLSSSSGDLSARSKSAHVLAAQRNLQDASPEGIASREDEAPKELNHLKSWRATYLKYHFTKHAKMKTELRTLF